MVGVILTSFGGALTPHAFDAEIDETGQVRLLAPLPNGVIEKPCRAIVVLLDGAAVDAALPPPAPAKPPRYEVIRPLASGGMASVFLATDTETGELVCVKRLTPGVDLLRNVQQECAALQRLQHPGVVRLLDRAADQQSPFLVMEYAAGITLREHVRRHGAMPEATVIGLLIPILEALNYCHSQMVTHRDLKPSNLIVRFDHKTQRLMPKVVDFGIAVVDEIDFQAPSSSGIGTTAYMAPEQFRREPVTPAADLYALGQIALELVSGQPAFIGNAREIAHRKQYAKGGLMLPSRLPFEVTEEFGRWIHDCTLAETVLRPSGPFALQRLLGLHRSLPQGVLAGPVNLRLQYVDSANGAGGGSALPDCWTNGTHIVGGASARAAFRQAEPMEGQDMPRVTMRFQSEPGPLAEFGCIAQRISAKPLMNRDIQLTAVLTPRLARGWTGIWLRAEGSGKVLAFVDSKESQSPLGGGAELHRLELTVPAGSDVLTFGALQDGEGEIDVMNFTFSVKSWGPEETVVWLRYSLWEETDLLDTAENLEPRGHNSAAVA